MKEGEKDGGCRRTIKMSRFISEAQKLRLLEQERHGTSHVRLQDRVDAVAKSIQKHRNLMLLEEERHRSIEEERDESSHVLLKDFHVAKCIQMRRNLKGEKDHGPLFRSDMKLATTIRFGQPIFRSFSEMLSEYYTRRYGVDLEVVTVQSNSCKGPLVTSDCAQRARWFHVNFTATIKDDDDGVSEKEYCAVLVLFSFRLAPLLCYVALSFPVDGSDTGNSCPCLFERPDSKIRHPRLEASHQASHRCNNAAKLNSSFRSLALHEMRVQLAGLKATSSKITTKEPRDLPVPKTIMFLEGKRKGTGPVRLEKLTHEMAQCVENIDKPRLQEPLPGCNWIPFGCV